MGTTGLRLFGVASVALLLGSCEDPLEPEREATKLASQSGPRVTTDPQVFPISPTQLNLVWPDNSSNETGWEVHRSTTGSNGVFSLLARNAANTTSYGDVELNPVTQYCYRVRWFRTNGKNTSLGSFSIVFCGTTYGPPSAPTDAKAIPGAFGRVDATWASTSFTTSGFRILRGTGSEGPWTLIATYPSWSRSYEDSGRLEEQQVCYQIVAFNDWGQTASNTACTTPPAPPDSLKARSADEHRIALTWKDRSSVEDGFEVQRSGDGYVWSAVATVSANATSYQDGGLASDTRYFYRVRSIKDGGFSFFSPIASAFTASTIPAAPTVSAVPSSSSTVDVSFYSQGAEGYRVERSTDGGITWEALNPMGNSVVDEGRNPEQTVRYRVVAFNRLGDSPPTLASTTPPAAPTNLSVDDQTNLITWSDNSEFEDGYELWLYTWQDPYYDPYFYPVQLPQNTSSYQAGPGEYVYEVAAIKDGGYSDWAFPIAIAGAEPSVNLSHRRSPVLRAHPLVANAPNSISSARKNK